MLLNESRRYFFRAAARVAAGLSLPSLFGSPAALDPPMSAQETSIPPFLSLPRAEIQKMIDGLQSPPGVKFFVDSEQLAFNARIQVEKATVGKEFEFHGHTDHFFQVLEGETLYEVGGTPEDARLIKPGEWLAPGSKGSTSIYMSKGDMLVIPHGTPHKRTTKESVVLLLISVQEPAGSGK